MNNILVLGSGRSGTSMTMGLMSELNFYFGDNYNYLGNRKANPNGFFEDLEINLINEDILKKSLINLPEVIRRLIFPSRTFYKSRWLARLPIKTKIKSDKFIEQRIKKIVCISNNFCFKDPRFSYTLPIWKKIFDDISLDVKYIVVYREPYKTAQSILKECKESLALNSLRMTYTRALDVWYKMYSHILMHYDNDQQKSNWIFIHYDHFFCPRKLAELESFVGASLNRDFLDRNFTRTNNFVKELNQKQTFLYQKLNQLSKFN